MRAGFTIRTALTPLGRVLSHAARRGLIASNPMSRLERGERPSPGRREMRILQRDEIHALLGAADPRYRPLLATAIFTGLRLGEVLGLTWADVDLKAGTPHVRKQLDRDGHRVAPKTPQAVRDVVLAGAREGARRTPARLGALTSQRPRVRLRARHRAHRAAGREG